MMRLLVVDDAKEIWMRMLQLLGDGACRNCVLVTTLVEGRRVFRELRPSLVVLDLQLPDGNGLSLLKEIKAEAPETEVAVFTNHPEFQRLSLSLGASRFFDKSLDFSGLLELLRERLAAATGEMK